MGWYKAGTVSVTAGSNAVIGSGTSFIANARVGDGFRGPDGRWYEVSNIASNTALSIAPNYQGTTAAGGGYSLAPMQGYVKESADQLRAATKVIAQQAQDLTNSAALAAASAASATQSKDSAAESANQALSSKNAAASSESSATASKNAAAVSEGSALSSKNAAAQSATSAASSASQAATTLSSKANKGANSDITSISGLTTPLSILQGGNGGSAPQKLAADDANNTVLPGVYSFGAGGLNLPTASAAYYLRVTINSTLIIQEALGMTAILNGKNYTRVFNGSAWSAWVPYSQAPSAPTWGAIGGALSAQLDLKTALDAKLNDSSADYTLLYPNGTPAAPATIAANSRVLVDNPFPGAPVIPIAEVLFNGIWSDPGFLFGSGAGYGTKASKVDVGDKIAIQTGSLQVLAASAQAGGGHNTTANASGPLPYRLRVWRIKG